MIDTQLSVQASIDSMLPQACHLAVKYDNYDLQEQLLLLVSGCCSKQALEHLRHIQNDHV
jgi:hypothetical protein